MAYKYIFGPVFSGRLGRSLGLDLLGAKICSLDCVYCEVGATRNLTLERKPYVPARDILDELKHWKEQGHEPPEFVTLGGMGEPTLNTDMPEVISGAKSLFPGIPVAVLTNATTMTDPEVRHELAQADVILPSLDSLVEAEFRKINRPCQGISASKVANSLMMFRKEYQGLIYLEVLLAKGVNDSQENLRLLGDFCKRLNPDRVDVVTLSRPGTLESAGPVDKKILDAWRKALNAGEHHKNKAAARDKAMSPELISEAAMASLARRPQTVLQLAQGLGTDEKAVSAALKKLEAQGRLKSRTKDGLKYFFAPQGDYTS